MKLGELCLWTACDDGPRANPAAPNYGVSCSETNKHTAKSRPHLKVRP